MTAVWTSLPESGITGHTLPSQPGESTGKINSDLEVYARHNALPVLISTGADDTASLAAVIAAVDAGTRLLFSARDAFTISDLSVAKRLVLDMQDANVTVTGGGLSFDTGSAFAKVLGGRLDCSGGTGAGVTVAPGVTDVTVRGVFVDEPTTYGIFGADGNLNIDIDNCTVRKSGSTFSYGMIAVFSSTVTDLRARVRNCMVIGGGIRVHGVGSGEAHRCKVTGNDVIMPVSPGADTDICIELQNAPGSRVVDNECLGGSMGVSLGGDCHFTTVTANHIIAPTIYGIEIAGSTFCTASANVIDGEGLLAAGIQFNVDSGSSTATGNTISGIVHNGIKVFNSIAVGLGGNMIKSSDVSIYLQGSPECTISGGTLDGGSVASVGIFLDNSDNPTISGVTLVRHTTFAYQFYAHDGFTFSAGSITGGFTDNTNPIGPIDAHGLPNLSTSMQPFFKVEGVANCPDYIDLAHAILRTSGNGSPEGAVYAAPGSQYTNYSGGTSTCLYIKETGGAGNTGWVAK